MGQLLLFSTAIGEEKNFAKRHSPETLLLAAGGIADGRGIAGLAMTANLWLDRPMRCSIGLGVVLVGLPFYFHWLKKSNGRVSPNTGI